MNSPSPLTAAVFARVAGIFVVVAAATAIFFGPTDNWMWDPSFYYAQMRTPLIEGSLDMSEDIYPRDVAMPRNKTGLIGSVWPLGPGLLWTPFFLVAQKAGCMGHDRLAQTVIQQCRRAKAGNRDQ